MNAPEPVSPAPVQPGAPVQPVTLAAKVTAGGAPLAIIIVWLLTQYAHAHLSDVEAATIGAFGASVIGYLWHVAEAFINAALKKAGAKPPSA